MTFIKQWTMCVCLSLIVSVIFSLIAPRGSMQRFYKVLISVFILVSFIVPFRDFHGFDFDWSAFGVESQMTENEQNIAQNLIKSEVTQFLKNSGITGADVSVTACYDGTTGEIDVTSLQIALPDTYDCLEIQQKVLDEMGFNAKVIHLGD